MRIGRSRKVKPWRRIEGREEKKMGPWKGGNIRTGQGGEGIGGSEKRTRDTDKTKRLSEFLGGSSGSCSIASRG